MVSGVYDAFGSVAVTSRPPEGALSSWMSPVSRLREVSSRVKGRKASSRCATGMPGQSSATVIVIASAASLSRTSLGYRTGNFFGVTGAQSAHSGLRQYRPDGGLKDAGISLDLDYSLTENWSVSGRLGCKRPLGDAADSPLVKDRGSANQGTTGLFLS